MRGAAPGLPPPFTFAAVLGSLACAIALRQVFGLSAQVPVLAVVLVLSLSRVPHRGGHAAAATALELVFVALAAAGAGHLLVVEPWIGGPLLVLGLSVGILARRRPGVVRRAGRLVALPFVALLVTPLPDGHPAGVLWAPVVGVLALAWTLAAAAVARRWTGWRPPPEPRMTATSRRRLDAPTRMAAQMAVGVGAALLVGHLLFGAGWAWAVLSAFIVQSGNRGRGDVVHKAALRLLGGLGGTAVATLVAGTVPPGHRAVLVLLFAVLLAGLVLRARNYAWWAAAVTAIVALLHSYYGQSSADVLGERLVGILLGSAIGVAAAWFVLPVRTRDVLRRRLFDALAALTDELAADADPEAPRYRAALARLDEIAPALRAHRHTLGRFRPDAAPIVAIDALHRLTVPGDPDERRRVRGATVWVRRSAAGREAGPQPALPAELHIVHTVLVSRPGRGGAPPAADPARAPARTSTTRRRRRRAAARR